MYALSTTWCVRVTIVAMETQYWAHFTLFSRYGIFLTAVCQQHAQPLLAPRLLVAGAAPRPVLCACTISVSWGDLYLSIILTYTNGCVTRVDTIVYYCLY